MNSQAYKVFNKRTKTVMESINIVIDNAIPEMIVDESGDVTSLKKNNEDGNSSQDCNVEKPSLEKESSPSPSKRETRSSQVLSSPLPSPDVQPPISHDDVVSTSKRPSSRVSLNRPKSNMIGDLDEGLRLRRGSVNHVTYHCYLTQFEPKKVEEALQDENLVDSMHQELHQFVRNDVWELAPRPNDTRDWNQMDF